VANPRGNRKPSVIGEALAVSAIGGDVPGQHSGMLFVPERNFALTLLTNSETGRKLVHELFLDDWALSRFAGLHNLPAAPQTLDASALAPYEGNYDVEQIGFEGPPIDAPLELRARNGRLQLIEGKGADANIQWLTFYKNNFVFVTESDGTPLYARCDFLRNAQGNVQWLRLGGRLFRKT
jgi:hypothetical protein